MLDGTAKKLLRLLRPDQPADLRRAAVTVLGEVGSRDAEVVQVLTESLQDADPAVRTLALTAVGQLHIDQALPQLLARVREGGIESEVAAQAAAHLGAKGTRALQELMGQVAPGLRRRIAAALGAGGSASAESAAVLALLDSDPGVVEAATRSLIAEIPTMPQALRHSLADHILESLEPKKGERLAAVSEAAFVRLLAALADPRGAAVFWARIDRSYPTELRAAALQALGTLPPPQGKDKFKRLLECAVEPDFRVAAPALLLLRAVPATGRTVADWLPLLDAADAAVRRFAIEKLRDQDTGPLALALLRQLGHPDRGLRETALGRLVETTHGRQALGETLLQAPTADEAWTLARALAPHFKEFATALQKKLFSQACSCLEAGDHRADALLFLLREVDARGVRDLLEERALALRKKKDYERSLIFLRQLARDPACALEVRFEMAACAIRLSEHDLAAESRQTNTGLQQLARLIHSHDTDPAERLRKAQWLAPEDLFYVGFHFSEGTKQERDFGAAALRLVLQRSPRSKLAKDARSKLKSAGLI